MSYEPQIIQCCCFFEKPKLFLASFPLCPNKIDCAQKTIKSRTQFSCFFRDLSKTLTSAHTDLGKALVTQFFICWICELLRIFNTSPFILVSLIFNTIQIALTFMYDKVNAHQFFHFWVQHISGVLSFCMKAYLAIFTRTFFFFE